MRLVRLGSISTAARLPLPLQPVAQAVRQRERTANLQRFNVPKREGGTAISMCLYGPMGRI